MNALFSILSSVMVLTLVTGFFIYNVDEPTAKDTVMPVAPHPVSDETDALRLQPISDETLDTSLDERQQTEQKTKMIGKLILRYDELSSNDTFIVRVALTFDASEEIFELKLAELQLEYNKVQHQTYHVLLNKQQILMLEMMEDVMILSMPDDQAQLAHGNRNE